MPPRDYERIPLSYHFEPPAAETAPDTSCPYIEKIHVGDGIIAVDGSIDINGQGEKLAPHYLRIIALLGIGMNDAQIAAQVEPEPGNEGRPTYASVNSKSQRAQEKVGARTQAHAVGRCFQLGLFAVETTIPKPDLDEMEVMYLQDSAEGLTAKEIAAKRGFKLRYARLLSSRVRSKFDTPSIESAVMLAYVSETLPPSTMDPAAETEAPMPLPQPEDSAEAARHRAEVKERRNIPRYTWEEWKQMFYPGWDNV